MQGFFGEGGDVGVQGRLRELSTRHSSLQYPSASGINFTVQHRPADGLEAEVDASDSGKQRDRMHASCPKR